MHIYVDFDQDGKGYGRREAVIRKNFIKALPKW